MVLACVPRDTLHNRGAAEEDFLFWSGQRPFWPASRCGLFKHIWYRYVTQNQGLIITIGTIIIITIVSRSLIIGYVYFKAENPALRSTYFYLNGVLLRAGVDFTHWRTRTAKSIYPCTGQLHLQMLWSHLWCCRSRHLHIVKSRPVYQGGSASTATVMQSLFALTLIDNRVHLWLRCNSEENQQRGSKMLRARSALNKGGWRGRAQKRRLLVFGGHAPALCV